MTARKATAAKKAAPARKAPAKKAPAKAPAVVQEPAVEGTAPEVSTEIVFDKGPGYVGETPDPTPNENYTVAGVLAELPTPETTHE